ncbi:MAG: FlgO family outer membrane protein [Neptuniibacter sp.]
MKKILLLLLVCLQTGCAVTEKLKKLSSDDSKVKTEQQMESEVRQMEQASIEEFYQRKQAHLEAEKAYLAEKDALLEKEKALLQRQVVQVEKQPNGIDPISEALAQMAVQMNAGLLQNRVKRLPVAVVPFTNLHNGRRVGRFGERLEQGMIYQLQQHGYNMIDYRAAGLVTSTKSPLSKQNLSELRVRYKIYFLVTGTYAQHSDGIVMNARVIDTTTRQVVASGQSHVANSRLEGGLPGYNPLEALNKGLIIENGNGPVGR